MSWPYTTKSTGHCLYCSELYVQQLCFLRRALLRRKNTINVSRLMEAESAAHPDVSRDHFRGPLIDRRQPLLAMANILALRNSIQRHGSYLLGKLDGLPTEGSPHVQYERTAFKTRCPCVNNHFSEDGQDTGVKIGVRSSGGVECWINGSHAICL